MSHEEQLRQFIANSFALKIFSKGSSSDQRARIPEKKGREMISMEIV